MLKAAANTNGGIWQDVESAAAGDALIFECSWAGRADRSLRQVQPGHLTLGNPSCARQEEALVWRHRMQTITDQ
jgi:hypothetical protein